MFDIQLQGDTVLSGYDIFADAGSKSFKATVKTFSVTASGGAGINLRLVNQNFFPTGDYLRDRDPGRQSLRCGRPDVQSRLSADNGATWTPLATGVGVDRFGRGTYLWNVPAGQPLGQYLVDVTSSDNANARAVSAAPFLMTNNGHDYYVNDGSQAGDVFTTAVGDNNNSGKSPDQPMANLAALLSLYTLGPGDVVHVDTGTYDLLRNVLITARAERRDHPRTPARIRP